MAIDFASELGLNAKSGASVKYADYLIAQMMRLYDDRNAEFGRAIRAVVDRFGVRLTDMLDSETIDHGMPFPTSASVQELFQSSGRRYYNAVARIGDADFEIGEPIPQMRMCPCARKNAPTNVRANRYERIEPLIGRISASVRPRRRMNSVVAGIERPHGPSRRFSFSDLFTLPILPEIPQFKMPPMPKMPKMPKLPKLSKNGFLFNWNYSTDDDDDTDQNSEEYLYDSREHKNK